MEQRRHRSPARPTLPLRIALLSPSWVPRKRKDGGGMRTQQPLRRSIDSPGHACPNRGSWTRWYPNDSPSRLPLPPVPSAPVRAGSSRARTAGRGDSRSRGANSAGGEGGRRRLEGGGKPHLHESPPQVRVATPCLTSPWQLTVGMAGSVTEGGGGVGRSPVRAAAAVFHQRWREGNPRPSQPRNEEGGARQGGPLGHHPESLSPPPMRPTSKVVSPPHCWRSQRCFAVLQQAMARPIGAGCRAGSSRSPPLAGVTRPTAPCTDGKGEGG